jgi:hypothetical protein
MQAVAEIEAANIEIPRRDRDATKVTGDRLRSISADVAASIAERFGGNKLSDVLADLLQATHLTKGGQMIADNRTRLATVAFIHDRIVGLPVQKIETLNVNLDADSAVGMEDRLRNSPALRQALKGILEKVENAEAVDVENVPQA